MSSQPFINNKKSYQDDYQTIPKDAPPPYYTPPQTAPQLPVHDDIYQQVHDNIYQQVHDDPIQAQPIPNTVPAVPPDVAINNGGNLDGYFFAAICMTACGLFMSSLVLFVCALPIAYCLYQASSVNDVHQKKRYLKAALFSSIAILVSGIILFLFFVIVFVAASYENAKLQANIDD